MTDFKLKPIEESDSPEIKKIKAQWEINEFILNELFKPNE
jgi:hypothetical protein